ncbi:hypothetical protein GIB67_017170 [Kingdonia uniflora]|uniref:Mitochondrial carrier protein n=1 Tax=Kingdonia uniflora TaxID=39325 RepID=A0A7J7KZK4_9MAGN|nr:hypothetical protein GIB67_017170 [Kingdonia uniflora]
MNNVGFETLLKRNPSSPSSKSFVINAPSEPGKIVMYSPTFYAACTLEGFKGFFRGWVPTLLGYSAQGACKFGSMSSSRSIIPTLRSEYAAKYKTLIYLAGSASAEVIADIALCPMEAVKLVQGYCTSLGTSNSIHHDEICILRDNVEMLYKYAIPQPKDQCSKSLQLGISFAGGYVAGVFCAYVSHPADNLVSFLNNAKGATVGDVSYLHLFSLREKDWCCGLFTRGLPLRIVMIGTLTGAQWGIYDAFKANYWWCFASAAASSAAPIVPPALVKVKLS